MATRWKSEPTESLVLQHAHNQWSMWNDCIVTAASRLGLPVAERSYPNGSGDGSWDRETYTLSSALERAGGMDAVLSLAETLHDC